MILNNVIFFIILKKITPINGYFMDILFINQKYMATIQYIICHNLIEASLYYIMCNEMYFSIRHKVIYDKNVIMYVYFVQTNVSFFCSVFDNNSI